MPDIRVLTLEERARADEWFQNGEWSNPVCPVSRHPGQWILDDHVVSQAVYPQIMVICRGCGYTIYINALVAGICGEPESFR